MLREILARLFYFIAISGPKDCLFKLCLLCEDIVNKKQKTLVSVASMSFLRAWPLLAEAKCLGRGINSSCNAFAWPVLASLSFGGINFKFTSCFYSAIL